MNKDYSLRSVGTPFGGAAFPAIGFGSHDANSGRKLSMKRLILLLGAAALLRRSLLVYGVGGVIAPFVGIKAIDMALAAIGIT